MRTLCLVLACASFALAANTTKPAASQSATNQHADLQQRWAPEELKGTVSMVDPAQDLVVVRDSSGVPFDFRIQNSTHIMNGQSAVKLSDLAKNESVNVRFVPEARGDIARQIQVH